MSFSYGTDNLTEDILVCLFVFCFVFFVFVCLFVLPNVFIVIENFNLFIHVENLLDIIWKLANLVSYGSKQRGSP